MNILRLGMVCLSISLAGWVAGAAELRPPAVPLVTCDPYFSIWSPADKLTDADTVHWTGKPHRLSALISVDGVSYRVLGTEPAGIAALPQIALVVLPTRTSTSSRAQVQPDTYVPHAGTPGGPRHSVAAGDLSRVGGRVRWTRKQHRVQLEFSASGELAVNTPDQEVNGSIDRYPDLVVAKIGSTEQPILAKRGDDIRIDWGYLYVAVPGDRSAAQVVISPDATGLPAAGGTVRAKATLDMGNVPELARVAVVDAGLRRSVFDPVHAEELAALLAPRRLASRRLAGSRRQRAARSPATLQRLRSGTDGRSDPGWR